MSGLDRNDRLHPKGFAATMALLAGARKATRGLVGLRAYLAFGLVRVARHGRLDVGHAHFDGHVYGADWLLFANGCFAEQR